MPVSLAREFRMHGNDSVIISADKKTIIISQEETLGCFLETLLTWVVLESLGIEHEGFQGALSGDHERIHFGASCGFLGIVLLTCTWKSPQRSCQPEMCGP